MAVRKLKQGELTQMLGAETLIASGSKPSISASESMPNSSASSPVEHRPLPQSQQAMHEFLANKSLVKK